MSVIKKTLLASLAALTLGIGLAATPAAADGVFHPPGGGAHIGGGHAGVGRGFAGGGGGGGAVHRGGGWGHGGGWGRGGGWGPAVGLGILGGVAAGAIIASQEPYYADPGYVYADDGCYQYRPVYDRWGRYLGRRNVYVCE